MSIRPRTPIIVGAGGDCSAITVMGLDPGLRRSGFAIAEANVDKMTIARVLRVGTIETERQHERQIRKTSDDLRRARVQAGALKQLVRDYRVSLVAVEMSTTTPYTLPTFSFGVMTGIVASLEVSIIEVLPHEVKSAATGNSRGTKAEIIEWAISMAPNEEIGWPVSTRRNSLDLFLGGKHVARGAEHPADALAAIVAALGTDQFRLGAQLFTKG